MIYTELLTRILGLSPRAAAAPCGRAVLHAASTSYLQALAAGQSNITTLATGFNYTENGKHEDLWLSVLANPVTVDFSRTMFDSTECLAFVEVTAATSKTPYVIHTQLHVSAGDGKIIAVDSVVSKAGDWAFNATSHLRWNKQETWDPIPKDRQDTRAVIKAALDAYLNNWGNVSLPVPEGTPCARLEGGGYTGAGNLTKNTCTMGAFPQPLNVTNRRYVIDEEYGAIDVLNDFPWLEATQPANHSIPSSNFMRIEGGKIRYIHEVTVCDTKNCGR